MIKIIRKNTSETIIEKVKIANTIKDKTLGLMFKKEMSGYDGLLILNCNAIHTHFMRFNLDAVFLDKENKVVKIIRNIKPWRFTKFYWKANKVLESQAGSITDSLKEGDELGVVDV